MRRRWAFRHAMTLFLCATRCSAKHSHNASENSPSAAGESKSSNSTNASNDSSNASNNAGNTTNASNDAAESNSSSSTKARNATNASNATSAGRHPPKWTVSARSCRGVDSEYSICSNLPACDPCKAIDCAFAAWTDWSSGDCSGLCQRMRGVETRNNRCGAPCLGPLTQTKTGCLSCEETADCEWGSWLDWDDCSMSCGGGFRTRLRFIKQEPVNGGRLCSALSRGEVEPCNTDPCAAVLTNCSDVEWKSWSPWSVCTAHCGGGLSWRARSYVEDSSKWCPLPEGKSQEMKVCNSEPCVGDIDCQFSDWDPWSGCSCSCSGVMRRARRVAVFGRGKGRYCEAATKEISPCNPADGERVPKGCEVNPMNMPKDCILSTWTEWDLCSASCDGGQRQRSRMVEQEPSLGGVTCSGVIEGLSPCNTKACHEVKMLSACKWSAWTEWGSCEHVQGCGAGVKRRSRDLLDEFHVEGFRCNQPNEEVAFCYKECQHHCIWGEWGPYSECSQTCGDTAVRHRERKMKLSIVPVNDLFDASYGNLESRAAEAERQRVQAMAVAFGGGIIGVVLGFFVIRATARARAVSP